MTNNLIQRTFPHLLDRRFRVVKNTEAGELFVVMKARILIYMFKVVDTLSIFYPGLQNLPKNKIQRFLHLQDHLEDVNEGSP